MSRRLIWINALLSLWGSPWAISSTYAAEPPPVETAPKRAVVQLKEAGQHISNMKLKSSNIELKVELDGAYYKAFAYIDGNYTRRDYDLLLESRTITRSKNGDFRTKIPIYGKSTEVNIFAIGPYGSVEKDTLVITVGEWERNRVELRPRPKPGWLLTPEVAFSYITYKQDNIAPFQETAVTAKLFFNTPIIPPNWDFGASGYFTVTPIGRSGPTPIRFLGLNLRFGYVLPFIAEPWRLSILAGAYYTTTFVQASAFGYKDVTGPQLFPMLRRTFKQGDSISFYFKFSPISSSFTLMSFSNREIAAGGAYAYPFKNGHPLSVNVDVSTLQLFLEGLRINSTAVSVGLGYGL